MAIAGIWAYNAVDDEVARLKQQIERAQNQLDHALDNNDRALAMYDDVLAQLEIDRQQLSNQLTRAIASNEDALRLYGELIDNAEESLTEAEKLPADLREFRLEVARLAVETYGLNSEIQLVQNDVRLLGDEIIGVAKDIEDFSLILSQVLDLIASGR